MRRFLVPAALALALGVLPGPKPADAAVVVAGCLREAVGSCNSDFAGETPEMVSIRGWCYMIRAALCRILE